MRGKLVKITADHVRLLKDTGAYTTVPMNRLSVVDLLFIQQQIQSARVDLTASTVQK